MKTNPASGEDDLLGQEDGLTLVIISGSLGLSHVVVRACEKKILPYTWGAHGLKTVCSPDFKPVCVHIGQDDVAGLLSAIEYCRRNAVPLIMLEEECRGACRAGVIQGRLEHPIVLISKGSRVKREILTAEVIRCLRAIDNEWMKIDNRFLRVGDTGRLLTRTLLYPKVQTD